MKTLPIEYPQSKASSAMCRARRGFRLIRKRREFRQGMGQGYHYSASKILVARALEILFLPLAWCLNLCRAGDVRRILILEPFGLGDAALLAVMLAPLKNKFPAAEIHLLLQPGNTELFSRDPRVTCAHGFVFPWARRTNKLAFTNYPWIALFRFLRGLRRLRFDIGIDARGEVRSQILMVLLGCHRRVGATNYLGSNMNIRGRLLTDNQGEVSLKHRTQLNLDLCAALGCTVVREHFLPALTWPAPPAPAVFTVLIHTGAGWRFRLWTESSWARLIHQIVAELHVAVRVAGAPDEQPRLAAIRRGIPEGEATFRTTTLLELVSEMQACDLMIALDSGPMNIATVLGKPVIALFGPGSVPLYAPISPGSRVAHHQSAYACAPCTQQICIHPHHNCVASIAVHEVFELIREQVAALRQAQAPCNA